MISVLVELEEVKLGMGPLPCLKRVSKPRPETLAARPFERRFLIRVNLKHQFARSEELAESVVRSAGTRYLPILSTDF